MARQMKRRWLGDEDGFAVVVALMVILIMSMLGITLMTVAAYQMMDTDRTKPSNRAFDLADCGLSWAHAYISGDHTYPPEGYSPGPREMGNDNNSTFDVTIKDLSLENPSKKYQYRITSTGTYTDTEDSGTRNYSRKLEEVVKYRGVEGHFDAFTYTLFSRDGDVTLNTGQWGTFSGNGITVNGSGGNAIYAGRNVTLEDTKFLFAGAKLTVNGNVHAGGDVNVSTRSVAAASANVSVSGNVIATGNVTVSSAVLCAAGANSQVTGSINAKGNVTLSSVAPVISYASTKVAQTSGSEVNAGGNFTMTSEGIFLAGSDTFVGNSGVASSVNAVGNSYVRATSGLSAENAYVYGNLKNNGTAYLIEEVFGDVRVNGIWQHGGAYNQGTADVGTPLHTNPGIQAGDIESLPDVELPVPDCSWYKTMAIAQHNYYTTDKTFTDITVPPDPSSMWVMYVEGNVTINNFINNVQKRGVIVSEGDVKITHAVQLADNTEYQVIAKGNVSHNSFLTLQTGANDKVFIYTDGSYDSNGNGISDDGNVNYDLGYFRDIQGQITCRGNIMAPVASFLSFDQHQINYASPCMPAEGWPIPFDVLSFKEL